MSDWKDEIKARIDDFNKRVSDITTNLNLLTNELRPSPYNYGTKVEQKNINNKASWEVTIDRKVVSITEDEISNQQKITEFDESGNQKVTGTKELKVALIELILKKFIWE